MPLQVFYLNGEAATIEKEVRCRKKFTVDY